MTEIQVMACREIAYELFKLACILAQFPLQIWIIWQIFKLKKEADND